MDLEEAYICANFTTEYALTAKLLIEVLYIMNSRKTVNFISEIQLE